MIKKIGIVLYLFWGSIQDIKTKTISSRYLQLGTLFGILILTRMLNQKSITVEKGIFSLIPGVLLLLFGKATKEKIGYGDGWLMIIMGMCLGDMGVWYLCQLSFLLSAIFSIVMMGIRRESKDNQIPFVPFIGISYLILWGMKYV